MSLKTFAKHWLSPGVVRMGQQLLARLHPPPWEYVPDGWGSRKHVVRGWNAESVAAVESEKWADFARLVAENGTLGVSHEARRSGRHDYGAHNTIMAFAYVLALAARRRERISVLDWGGGLGHYYLLARAVVPDLELDYHCKDFTHMCRLGRELLPEVHFHDTVEGVRGKRYDLVIASSSLHYSENWREVASDLVAMTGSYLFITRMPIVLRSRSFVVVQRPHGLNYRTEYFGWFLNRGELVDTLQALGMTMLREFLIDERPFVHRAPEQCEYRGFLWRPSHGRAEAQP
jgi:putative methyltransferase (TIGR04325 family)